MSLFESASSFSLSSVRLAGGRTAMSGASDESEAEASSNADDGAVLKSVSPTKRRARDILEISAISAPADSLIFASLAEYLGESLKSGFAASNFSTAPSLASEASSRSIDASSESASASRLFSSHDEYAHAEIPASAAAAETPAAMRFLAAARRREAMRASSFPASSGSMRPSASALSARSLRRADAADPPDGCSSSMEMRFLARAAFSDASFSACILADSAEHLSTTALSESLKSASLENMLSSERRVIASSQSRDGSISESFEIISDFLSAARRSSRSFRISCARAQTGLPASASASGSRRAHSERIFSESPESSAADSAGSVPSATFLRSFSHSRAASAS